MQDIETRSLEAEKALPSSISEGVGRWRFLSLSQHGTYQRVQLSWKSPNIQLSSMFDGRVVWGSARFFF